MLSRIFGKKQNADVVVKAITELSQQMDLRFKELSAQVREVELGLAQMETKLLSKDLKDKQAYGLLHYKLHEAKHTTLNDEVSDLERQLERRLEKIKDQ